METVAYPYGKGLSMTAKEGQEKIQYIMKNDGKTHLNHLKRFEQYAIVRKICIVSVWSGFEAEAYYRDGSNSANHKNKPIDSNPIDNWIDTHINSFIIKIEFRHLNQDVNNPIVEHWCSLFEIKTFEFIPLAIYRSVSTHMVKNEFNEGVEFHMIFWCVML